MRCGERYGILVGTADGMLCSRCAWGDEENSP